MCADKIFQSPTFFRLISSAFCHWVKCESAIFRHTSCLLNWKTLTWYSTEIVDMMIRCSHSMRFNTAGNNPNPVAVCTSQFIRPKIVLKNAAFRIIRWFGVGNSSTLIKNCWLTLFLNYTVRIHSCPLKITSWGQERCATFQGRYISACL